jgi:hypothetical protein
VSGWDTLGFVLGGLWLVLIAVCLGDIWRREDFTPWTRVGWTAAVVLLPFLGTVVYLIVGFFMRDALSGA